MPEPATGGVVPIESLFHDDAGPHILVQPRPVSDIVPIENLLLRGAVASRAALELRPTLEQACTAHDQDGIRHLLDELFDLVRLGGEPDSPPG